jgi:hypothetical protein
VPTDGLIYATTDVYTSPPTLLCIVGSNADAARALARHPDAFVIDAADVLMHKGWIDALHQFREKPDGFADHTADSLNVCFHHAFGRCRGRRDGNTATCQQLHILPSALHEVRRMYRNPVRPFFVRSFTGMLPPLVYGQMAHVMVSAGASLAEVPQTLDFPSRDVEMSEGARRVDTEFRSVLTDPNMAHIQLRPRCLMLCLPFALGLTCPIGTACELLHAPLANTSSRIGAFANSVMDTCTSGMRQQLADEVQQMAAAEAAVSEAAPPPAYTEAAPPPYAAAHEPRPVLDDAVSAAAGNDATAEVTAFGCDLRGDSDPLLQHRRTGTPAASLVLVPASADETHLLSDLAGYLGTHATDGTACVGTVG